MSEQSFEQKLTTLQRTIESVLYQAKRIDIDLDWNERLERIKSVELALETATEHASDLDEIVRRTIAEGVL